MKSDVDSATSVDDSPIMMTVTVANDQVKHDLSQDDDWECDDTGSCTRSWTVDQFDPEDEITFDSTHLILKKQIAQDCSTVVVGGVSVCIDPATPKDFVCKYPLGTQTVSNINTAKNNNAVEEGTGTLNYKLVVTDPDIKVGDEVNVEVVAVNKGLVWHTLKDCTVSNDDSEIPILTWHETEKNLVTHCPNYFSAVGTVPTHDEVTEFSWKAFKWLSSDSSDEVDMKSQKIECKISLSQDEPTFNTPTCDASYTKIGSGCYKDVIDHRVSYNAAETFCEVEDAFLSVPNNADEMDNLAKFFKQAITKNDWENAMAAIGVKADAALKWRNVYNGEEIKYTNWSKTEDYQAGEDFVGFNENGEWIPYLPSNMTFVICQKPAYLC